MDTFYTLLLLCHMWQEAKVFMSFGADDRYYYLYTEISLWIWYGLGIAWNQPFLRRMMMITSFWMGEV
jgi:hypothetical protein